jgi:transposase
MKKKYVVRLTAEERKQLESLVGKGKACLSPSNGRQAQAYKIKHANILLSVDADGPGWLDKEAAEAFRCHECTVRNVRQRCVEKGLEAALERKPQESPPRKPTLDGRGQARLVALACSTPPNGRSRWTLDLLADRLVEMKIVPSISNQTVRRTLKKTSCGRICGSNG